MKKIASASALLLAFMLMMAPSAHAQADLRLGPRATVGLGDIADAPGSDIAIGADVRLRAEGSRLQANGSLDYYPADDDLTFTTVDLNAIYLIATEDASLTPYVGVGLGINNISTDVDGVGGFGDSSELGVNFVGGFELNTGDINPFAQVQFTNGDDLDRFGITGGLLFRL